MCWAELLSRARAGDKQAASDLIAALLPLADRYAARQVPKLADLPWIDKAELQSQLHLDLCEAVDRLTRNSVAAENVERFVKGHLKHSLSHMLRSVSDDLLPSAEEPRRRKLKNMPAPEPIKRTRRMRGRIDAGDELIHPFDDPLVETWHTTDRIKQLPVGHELEAQEERDMAQIIVDRLPQFARTPLEKTIAACLSAHLDLDELKQSLPGISESMLLNTIEALSARVRAHDQRK